MKRGFLLMNTGSPDDTSEEALRVYLKEFLMDPYVIDLPFPLRYALVHWLILPKRPAESAEAYKAIWTENGSPLVHYCSTLARGLNKKLQEPLEVCMAYRNPSVASAIDKLLAQGVEEIGLLPMFPHYAMATTGGCTALVKKVLKGRAKLRVAPPFYNIPELIDPIAESLKDVKEHILFSYHGLPVRHLKKTDPTGSHCMQSADCCRTASPAHATCYRHQCFETTRLVVEKAGLEKDRYSISFQSRLGRDPWLEPYTDKVLEELPKKGIKELAVICPAFFCDCLETLEEIQIRGQETFKKAGGESFRMIPCLNDSPAAFHCLETLISNAGNWPAST
ncbi:ferrochelatase [Pontiella agarivorans]|uniref:Ferrochelatase n=1 Tax=Pontiella agarivorans TaxID=3038953 RepID=A0ABU5MXH8_9BACT|nr:ferrochelatase [Pontiella agarivorans]MDZ8118930.1 ferrochelatase [Pontiella agarivorans]